MSKVLMAVTAANVVMTVGVISYGVYIKVATPKPKNKPYGGYRTRN